MKEYLDSSQPHRALLIGVALPGIAPEEARVSLDELAALAATAGVTDAGRILQSRPKVDAAFYIGKGKVAQIKSDAEAAEADLLIFDNELSPAQMRNLEDELQLQILDRSLLILEIFARHARTRTAQIQVERAWLNYLLPRLSGRWTHLSRQRGGGNATRGPGETQLALDRRKIGQRQGALSGQLQRIRRQAATGRKQRQGEYKVALVGYTNAGKSSLMRALSSEDVLVQDQLFATLDSTTRKVDLRGGKILLTDTVGFINRLPHHLFESFRTTLEEAIDADLLLHVVDRSHPRYRQQIETVNEVLAELNIGDKTLLTVFNKMDRVDRTAQQQGLDEELQAPHSLAVSAHSGEGLEDLQDRIHALRTGGAVVLHLDIPQHEGHLLSQLHHRAEILAVEYDGDQAHMQVRLDRDWAASQQIKRYVADCA